MKKYKYRIVQIKGSTYLRVRRKRLGIMGLISTWKYVDSVQTGADAENVIKRDLKNLSTPDELIIQEINPHAK